MLNGKRKYPLPACGLVPSFHTPQSRLGVGGAAGGLRRGGEGSRPQGRRSHPGGRWRTTSCAAHPGGPASEARPQKLVSTDSPCLSPCTFFSEAGLPRLAAGLASLALAAGLAPLATLAAERSRCSCYRDAPCAPIVLRHGALLILINEPEELGGELGGSDGQPKVAVIGLAEVSDIILCAASPAEPTQQGRSIRDLIYRFNMCLSQDDVRLLQQVEAAFPLLRHMSHEELVVRCHRIGEPSEGCSEGCPRDVVKVDEGATCPTKRSSRVATRCRRAIQVDSEGCPREVVKVDEGDAEELMSGSERYLVLYLDRRVRAATAATPPSCATAYRGSAFGREIGERAGCHGEWVGRPARCSTT